MDRPPEACSTVGRRRLPVFALVLILESRKKKYISPFGII
jgi:hypothetical protein